MLSKTLLQKRCDYKLSSPQSARADSEMSHSPLTKLHGTEPNQLSL